MMSYTVNALIQPADLEIAEDRIATLNDFMALLAEAFPQTDPEKFSRVLKLASDEAEKLDYWFSALIRPGLDPDIDADWKNSIPQVEAFWKAYFAFNALDNEEAFETPEEQAYLKVLSDLTRWQPTSPLEFALKVEAFLQDRRDDVAAVLRPDVGRILGPFAHSSDGEISPVETPAEPSDPNAMEDRHVLALQKARAALRSLRRLELKEGEELNEHRNTPSEQVFLDIYSECEAYVLGEEPARDLLNLEAILIMGMAANGDMNMSDAIREGRIDEIASSDFGHGPDTGYLAAALRTVRAWMKEGR